MRLEGHEELIIERVPTGWLTILGAWSFLPLLVPLASVTPDELQGRIQSTMQFVSMSAMPLAPILAGVLLSGLGGGRAMAALGVLTALVALVPTLSRQVRAVPRPAQWVADVEATPVALAPTQTMG